MPDYGHLGRYNLWILIDNPGSINLPTLHSITVTVPRRFYVNLRTPKPSDSGPLYHKVAGTTNTKNNQDESSTYLAGCILPRNHSVFHLYEYNVPEELYAIHESEISADLARPDIEGVYELGVPSLFRLLTKVGCLCSVDRKGLLKSTSSSSLDDANFSLDQLKFCSSTQYPYLDGNNLRFVFLFHYHLPSGVQGLNKRDVNKQVSLNKY